MTETTHKNQTIKDTRDLLQSLNKLESKDLVNFIKDILSAQEIEVLSLRWKIIRALHSGTPQREIAAKLKCSITTVSRGSNQLQHGYGGFKAALIKTKKI